MKKISKINYFYQAEKNISSSKLNDLFKNSSIEYYRRLKKFKISNSWDLRFFIYHDLKLNNLGKIDKSKSRLLQTYKLKYQNKKKNSVLILHLDSSLFYNLLRRKISWNGAVSGSFILYERKPNIFFPDLTWSLNFLTI